MTVVFTNALATSDNTYQGVYLRVPIPAAQLTAAPGTSLIQVSFKFMAGTSTGVIDNAYVGEVGSPHEWDFDGNQVQLRFSGSTSKTGITGAVTITSDTATFNFDATKKLVVSVHFSGGQVNVGQDTGSTTGVYYWVDAGTTETGASNPTSFDANSVSYTPIHLSISSISMTAAPFSPRVSTSTTAVISAYSQPNPALFQFDGGNAPYVGRRLPPSVTNVPVSNPPISISGRGASIHATVASVFDAAGQPAFTEFFGGAGPFVPRYLPASITNVTVNNPPFNQFIEEVAVGVNASQPDPSLYQFDGGNAPFVGRHLSPSITNVQVSNPSFGFAGNSPDVQAQISSAWLPDPALYEFVGGAAPFMPRRLSASIIAVQVDNPIANVERDIRPWATWWIPSDPLPTLQPRLAQGPPAQAFVSSGPLGVEQNIVSAAWIAPDPKPQIQLLQPQGAPVSNPSFGTAGNSPEVQAQIAASWQPDPVLFQFDGGNAPFVGKRLPPALDAVQVDSPIALRPLGRNQNIAVEAAWISPDPKPQTQIFLPQQLVVQAPFIPSGPVGVDQNIALAVSWVVPDPKPQRHYPGIDTSYLDYSSTPNYQQEAANLAWQVNPALYEFFGGNAPYKPKRLSPNLLRKYAWFDSSDLQTITSSGGKISVWEDKISGGVVKAVQAVSANQPGFVSPPVTSSLGAVQYMTVADLPVFDGPFTILFVAASGNATGFTAHFQSLHSGGNSGGLGFKGTASSNTRFDVGRTGSTDTADFVLPAIPDFPAFFVGAWTGTDGLGTGITSFVATPWLNGTKGNPLTVTGYTETGLTGLMIGSALSHADTGDFGNYEFLIFPYVLSDAEIISRTDDLTTKWTATPNWVASGDGVSVWNYNFAIPERPPWGYPPKAFAAIYSSWIPPLPQAPVARKLAAPLEGVRVDNPPFANQWLRRSPVLEAWAPIPPLPMLPQYLPTSVIAVAADRPIGGVPQEWLATIAAAWIPPDPLPTVAGQISPAFTSVVVNVPSFGPQGAESVYSSWVAPYQQPQISRHIPPSTPFVYVPSQLSQDAVFATWELVPPQPIVNDKLNPAYLSIQVDAPPVVGPGQDGGSVAISWIPPAPQAPLGQKVSPAFQAITVSSVPFPGPGNDGGVALASWVPPLPQAPTARRLNAAIEALRVDDPPCNPFVMPTGWALVDPLPMARRLLPQGANQPAPPQRLIAARFPAWEPVPRIPIIRGLLNPDILDVTGDIPPISAPYRVLNGILSAWVPPPPAPIVLRVYPRPPAVVNNPPFRNLASALSIISSAWVPPPPQPIIRPPTRIKSQSTLPPGVVVAFPGETLEGHVGLWINGVTGYDYQWYRSGQPIPGAGGTWPGSNAEYQVLQSDIGSTIFLSVWASNKYGTSAHINSNAILIISEP